jgi:hypothetical protein
MGQVSNASSVSGNNSVVSPINEGDFSTNHESPSVKSESFTGQNQEFDSSMTREKSQILSINNDEVDSQKPEMSELDHESMSNQSANELSNVTTSTSEHSVNDSVQQSMVNDQDTNSEFNHSEGLSNTNNPSHMDSAQHSNVSGLNEQSQVSTMEQSQTSLINQSETSNFENQSPEMMSGVQSIEADVSHISDSHKSVTSLNNQTQEEIDASHVSGSMNQEMDTDVDHEAVTSNPIDTEVDQSISDQDAISESLDDQLNKLENMDEVGNMDHDMDSKSTVSGISTHSSTISPLNVGNKNESESTESLHIDQEMSNVSDQVSEQIVSKEPEQFSQSQDEDIETVLTDGDDKPLTEEDKEVIMDELEGKPVKANIHLNHKSIESLHHINVYHYLPPKYIPAGNMPNVYPGMVPQQTQPINPGPIINIHNSTTSAGGNGTNNAYDVGPDGKLHSMNDGSAQSVIATPAQNWGQVVYSNTHHHAATSNVVNTSNESTVSNVQNDDDLNKERKLYIDNESSLQNNFNDDDEWDKAFNSFGKDNGNLLDMDMKSLNPNGDSLQSLAPSKFSEQIDSFSGSPSENLSDLMGGMSEDDLLNDFVKKNENGFQEDMEDEQALRNFEKQMNSRSPKKVPVLI